MLIWCLLSPLQILTHLIIITTLQGTIILQRGDWSTERLSNFPKCTQLGNDQARVWTQAIWYQSPHLITVLCCYFLSWPLRISRSSAAWPLGIMPVLCPLVPLNGYCGLNCVPLEDMFKYFFFSKFWNTCAEHAGLFHSYTHAMVVCHTYQPLI